MTTFWFAPRSPRPLAVMRIGLAVVLLAEMAGHWPYVVESYSNAGRPMPPFTIFGVETPVPTPTVAVAAMGLLVFALVSSALGFLTRISLLTSFGLLGWFALLDFPNTLTKYTAIALHLLLLLAVSDSSATWSLDRRWFGRPDLVRLAPSWPTRLMQILVCHVYVGAAITKWRGHFSTGDTLAFSLIDDRWSGGWFGPEPAAWLATNPPLLVLASFATVAFECAFPLLIWFRSARRPMLIAAVFFHVGLASFLSLRSFTPVMFVALFAFVKESDLRTLGCVGSTDGPAGASRESRSRIGRALLAATCWAVLGGVAGLSAVAIQRTTDEYGVFGNGSPGPLARIAADEAETLFTDDAVPPAARVHRIDVGHRSTEWQVFGSPSRFAPGESVHVMLQFVRERPPLNVEVVLVDPDDEPAELRSGYVPPLATRWRAAFELPADVRPGTWTLEFFVQGELVERRRITVVE